MKFSSGTKPASDIGVLRPVCRQYQLQWPGLLYLATTLFLAIGALNSQNNLLFWAFGLAVGGLLVSGVLSIGVLRGLEIQRQFPQEVVAGEPVRLRYVVHNRRRVLPAFGLSIEELPSRSTRRRPAPTWPTHVSKPSLFVQHVARRSSAPGVGAIRPKVRGRATFARLRLSTTFPFGLVRRALVFDAPAVLTVLPANVPLRPDLLNQLRADGVTGTELHQRSGAGDEIFGLREYSPGDSPRQISWKASARHEQLLVKQRTAPAVRRLWVAVDSLASASQEDAEVAIAVAASLLRWAADRGYAIGLVVPGKVPAPPRRGAAGLARLLQKLSEIDASEDGGRAPTRFGRNETLVRIGAGIAVERGGGETISIDVSRRESFLAPGHELPEVLRSGNEQSYSISSIHARLKALTGGSAA